MDRVAVFFVMSMFAGIGSSSGVEVVVDVPPVVVIETLEAYPVTGSRIAELRRALHHDRLPAESGGGSGNTRAEFEINYVYDRQAESCRLVAAEVVLRLTTRLPEWQPRKIVDQKLVRRWDEGFAALLRHEKEHANHARAAAETIRKGLLELDTERPRCRDIEWIAQRNFRRVMLKLELRSQRFDQRTNFGRADDADL